MPRVVSTDKLFDMQTYTERTKYMLEMDAPRDKDGKLIGPNSSAATASIVSAIDVL